MNRLDPRAPVIVGIGQINRREPDERDPVGLMADACRMALRDAGASGAPGHIDLLAVLDGLWSWRDPGRLVAERIGAGHARSLLTTFGGHTPQALTGRIAERIAAGELGAALVCGGEDNHTRRRDRRRGEKPARTAEPSGAAPDETYGEPLDMGTALETERGLGEPVVTYAVIESMFMAESTDGPEAHVRRLGDLWAGFAAVAAANPWAADRRGIAAEAIVDVAPDNRMVAWPYTKAMCANNDVDMAGALLICSVEVAETLAVPRDRWVFPWASAEAHDTSELSARRHLHRSPALAAAGQAVLERACLTIDDVAHLELYACFPSIVEMTVSHLGIDPARQLTMTGGLGFAGAPMNTSTLHGICAMVDALRGGPGVGLVQGNGGNATHHAFGLYSAAPPGDPYARIESEPRLDRRPVAPADAAGPVTVEGFTVRHDREDPTSAIVSCLTEAGARAWGHSSVRAAMEDLMGGAVGRTATLCRDGEILL